MKDMNKMIAVEIARLVAQSGGTAYYIGGYVRDKLRGKTNKDIDIEIHGILPQQLEEILDRLGERVTIGEIFGVYNLKGYSVDIAMPRSEESLGKGHKDLSVRVDPFIGTYGAAMRRDFTFNALMENILTGEIVDHFDGISDLYSGVIRHIDSSSFVEDPLRALRAAQFAARFGFSVSDETLKLCAGMDLSFLPHERIMSELEKALLQSEKPSVFFETLRQMNQLSVWFPELERTIDVPQNPKHHAEGDVWTHTMMVLDVAVRFRDKVNNPLGFMLAAVTHDFGKILCTKIVNGEIHAYNHETIGIPLVESFMSRLTAEKALIRYVMNLSEYHMKPNMLAADNSSIKATNRLFDRSVDPDALVCIAISDGLGKIAPREYVSYDGFFEERLSIYKEYMSRPYVTGRDLVAAGLSPSERFTDYLSFAHKLRLAGIARPDALRQVLALARKSGDVVSDS